jgi:hypothetical protein
VIPYNALNFEFANFETPCITGDSKCLWTNMTTMYENVCGKSVGRIELTFL